MKKQETFSDMEYSNRKRKTKREEFLETLDKTIPWEDWTARLVPYYPSGKRGRPPRGIELMLRMYLLKNWFNLSDELLEDAIYDSYAMRKFAGLDFFKQQVPSGATLLRFRHLIEDHGIGVTFFNELFNKLEKDGLVIKAGTITEASLIRVPVAR